MATNTETNVLKFSINGQSVSVTNPDPRTLLIEWLRYNGYTGTKFSCGQGGCGACTVIVCPNAHQPLYRAINACLRPLLGVHGLELLTVEGIGSTQTKLDIVQETIAKYNGSQCGYCTPGFVCAMKSYLWNTESNKQSRTLVDIEDIFDGHLCRCTGYRPILCGLKTFAHCGNKKELEGTPELVIDPSFNYSKQDMKHKNVRVVEVEETDYPQLQLHSTSSSQTLSVSGKDGSVWIHLQTLTQLKSIVKKYSNQKERIHYVVGNTAYGIQIFQEKIKKQNINLYIGDIPDLLGIHDNKGSSCLIVGGAERLQRLFEHMKKICDSIPKDGSKNSRSTFPPLVVYQHMMRLATTEIRDAGSLAGNLYLAKKFGFPSDLLCILMTLDAKISILTADKSFPTEHSIVDFMADDCVQLDGLQIIHSVKIPIATEENRFTQTYKISLRPQNSHPIVNAGFTSTVDIDANCFRNVRILFGNIGQKTQRMPVTEKFMQNECSPKELAKQLSKLLSTLYSELSSITTASHGTENFSPEYGKLALKYRLTSARNLFLKYLIEVANVFVLPDWSSINQLKSAVGSLINERMNSTSSGSQDFCVYKNEEPISEPLVKQSAFLQACGEAKYTQDLAMSSHDLLHGVYIFNTRYAHAKFDFDKKKLKDDLHEKFPNVKIFTAEDVDANPNEVSKQETKGKKIAWQPVIMTLLPVFHRQSVVTHEPKDRNDLGHGFPNLVGDTLFAREEVIYIGQPMGMVVAKHENIARDAAKWIQENAIKWRLDSIDKEPILELKDAIEKKHFFPDKSIDKSSPSRLLKVSRPVSLESIDWDNIKSSDPDDNIVIVEGSQLAGSQYHFYMENQTAVAYPLEGGKLKVVASTQSPSTIQSKAAQVCRLPMNYIIVEMPRLGGGYGGKEPQSQFVAAAASFCAHKLKKSVSVSLLRTEDMDMIGKRHEVFGKYKAAVSKTGKIQALEFEFFSNGGCTYDASFPVMDLILLSSDNAYNIPQFMSKGQVCMTFKATNTAFRSFGVIQTMLIVESAIEAIAEKVSLPAEKIRELNFYKRNDVTPYGQRLQYCNLEGVWDHIYKTADYSNRKSTVNKFNKENKLKKRGIKLIPLKYGISFTRKMMNQGGALVCVYANDGTVLVNIGGVEMGQGLNTKMMQIAAYVLNVPFDYIEIGTTATDKVPNAPSTGASTGSDLNGGAVKDACLKLRKRLENLLDRLVKDGGFETYWGNQKILLKQWKAGNRSWKEYWPSVVSLAYEERVSLAVSGFFKSTDLDNLTNENPEGRAFYYFNYAAAVSEVEVDVLTGETTIIRSDIVYDAGHSLNPAIDIGQIEGGFIMGVGNVLTEKLVFDKDGRLITNGTWEYKPPDTKTIPKDLRVTIYPGANKRPTDRIDHTKDDEFQIDPHGIQSSKATGEPPLVLANSVFFAIRDAVKEARKESGLSTEEFELDSPATVEEVQLACGFDPDKIIF